VRVRRARVLREDGGGIGRMERFRRLEGLRVWQADGIRTGLLDELVLDVAREGASGMVRVIVSIASRRQARWDARRIRPVTVR